MRTFLHPFIPPFRITEFIFEKRYKWYAIDKIYDLHRLVCQSTVTDTDQSPQDPIHRLFATGIRSQHSSLIQSSVLKINVFNKFL